eukprot:Em0002g1840a
MGEVLVRLRRVLHWGPLIALTIITIVTISGSYSAIQLWARPKHRVTFFRWPNFIVMYAWLFLILKNFYQALHGPGSLPRGWKPGNPEDCQFLQYCKICEGYKAPRSHHCHQCERCSMKMDHHCPWINNCVGHENHASFLRFTFYVPLGCLHGAILNANFLYRVVTNINVGWIIMAMMGIAVAMGAAIGVFILFATQVYSICKNETQIEEWIISKARQRRKRAARSHGVQLEPFVYPYNLGSWENFKQVVNFSGRAKGNGVEWPVKEGCNPYSLSIEQLEQKKEKKEHVVEAEVVRPYNGACCPCSHGLCVALCGSPVDRRVPIETGDSFAITKYDEYWVYGDVLLSETEMKSRHLVSSRGWVPRHCIKERRSEGRGEGSEGMASVPTTTHEGKKATTSEGKKKKTKEE